MRKKQMTPIIAALAVLLVAPTISVAHEFWIEPKTHLLEAGQSLGVELKVGENFKGNSFPYLSNRFVSYRLTDATGTRDYKGLEGDQPSMALDSLNDGMTIISYHSTPDRLEYSSKEAWKVFVEYNKYEGNDWAIKAHLKEGLSTTDFDESYTRYAKALIQVGEPSDKTGDRSLGQKFEIVALKNPFLPDTRALPVKVIWNGAPSPDTQIAIFNKADSGDRSTLRTDANGQATIPLLPGTRYMLAAVMIERGTTPESSTWESHWANLTFSTAAK